MLKSTIWKRFLIQFLTQQNIRFVQTPLQIGINMPMTYGIQDKEMNRLKIKINSDISEYLRFMTFFRMTVQTCVM